MTFEEVKYVSKTHGIGPIRVVSLKPYDEAERAEIYLEAQRLHSNYYLSGPRGMTITEQDGIEYWVHIATMDRLRKDMNKDVQSS